MEYMALADFLSKADMYEGADEILTIALKPKFQELGTEQPDVLGGDDDVEKFLDKFSNCIGADDDEPLEDSKLDKDNIPDVVDLSQDQDTSDVVEMVDTSEGGAEESLQVVDLDDENTIGSEEESDEDEKPKNKKEKDEKEEEKEEEKDEEKEDEKEEEKEDEKEEEKEEAVAEVLEVVEPEEEKKVEEEEKEKEEEKEDEKKEEEQKKKKGKEKAKKTGRADNIVSDDLDIVELGDQSIEKIMADLNDIADKDS